MDITVTLDRDDLYAAVADYLAKHGQAVADKSISMNIKAGRGVAEADIAATVILSTSAPKVAPPVVETAVEEPLQVAEAPKPKAAPKKAKPEPKAEVEEAPFDDTSADEAKKSLFDDPKGREPAPTNPLFG